MATPGSWSGGVSGSAQAGYLQQLAASSADRTNRTPGVLELRDRVTADYARCTYSRCSAATSASLPEPPMQTPMTSARPRRRSTTPTRSATSSRSKTPRSPPDMVAVLRAQRRAAAPLGKTELLATAGLDAKGWTPTLDVCSTSASSPGPAADLAANTSLSNSESP